MSDHGKMWWRQPLRIVQTNLQVKDTALIEPKRLAAQMQELGANTLVFNVGGIYAWYPSRVFGHKGNDYLPAERDLLREVIDACRELGIRFVARLDFSKTDDVVYLKKPKWFVRERDGQPQIVGGHRPGPWSLLMSTCINGGYRNEEVAIPVLEEVLGGYDVDGIFFNAPHYVPCYCDVCRRKYRARYGAELPAEVADFAADWASSCIRDNMELMYAFIKRKRPEVAMIVYYNLYRDNLFARAETADLLCVEPQDVLSEGHRRIPEFWKPALSVKLGRSLPDRPAPLGIVHSSPGMEWRHTGLPPAEYRFWLSQIPAHGGSIWHSLTGIPETITDKRILDVVAAFNRDAARVEREMAAAAPLSQAALLWTANSAAEGWADGLINRQIPFDVLLEAQATAERLARYRVLIVPEGMALGETFVAVLEEYARAGGWVVCEGAAPRSGRLEALLGIAANGAVSEPLAAAYVRFEGAANPLQRGLETTELIALRGKVFYTEPAGADTEVLATLVPPFSPLESVGAPPERASLPVERTDIPLALRHAVGSGGTLYFPFSLSYMLNEFKLDEHYRLLANAIDLALGGDKLLDVSHYQGLQATLFENDGALLLHLVNGAGRRPLSANMPLHGIDAVLKLNGRTVTGVRRLIVGDRLAFDVEGDTVKLTIPRLDVWECVRVELA